MKNLNMKKVIIIAAAAVVLLSTVIGGTLAWLMDNTEPVKNTFTIGDIEITLTETTGDTYYLSAGETIKKDPTLTVKANSVSSWVFVKVEETPNAVEYLSFETADGWTKLETGAYNDREYVIYRQVDFSTEDVVLPVLKNDQVVATNFSDAPAGEVSLTFTGYAIQTSGFDTPAAAWAELNAQLASN